MNHAPKPEAVSQCDTCAFKPGSVTHEAEPHNRLKGLICSLGGLPFHCHYSTAGDWHDLGLGKLNAAEARSLNRELPICAGWKAEVKALASRGHFRKGVRMVRRYLAEYALQQLAEFTGAKGKREKKYAARELKRALEMIKENPKTEKELERRNVH
jgi:hypothetical protein